MITYCSQLAGSRAVHVNQAYGEYVWHLNRLSDKEVTLQLPQVSYLHILEVG